MKENMVKEVQLVVGPEDIKKFGLQCASCGTTVTLNVDEHWVFPDSCPVCHAGWKVKEAESQRNFFELLLRVCRAGQSPVRVRMVFDGEEI